jgi:hypothetical protein
MSASTIGRRLSLLALVAAACVAQPVGAAYAQATPEKFYFQDSGSETITNFPCFEGIPVTMTWTLTTEGHMLDDTERHRSYHFIETTDYRVDIGDGRYATGGVVNHFTVTVNMLRPRTTATSTQQEQAILYTSDGQPVGEITFQSTSHKTYSDTNGDRFPDPDEITVAVDRVRITCP